LSVGQVSEGLERTPRVALLVEEFECVEVHPEMVQALPSSLPGLSSRPRIRRSPFRATPVATRAAIDTTRRPEGAQA
jgi:hypothetical protein